MSSLAIAYARAKWGITAPLVTVEVHLSNGLPGFSIVGLPEATVKESKERVRSAILNSNFEFPMRRITVNLAPADLPKEGGRFDLAIALGILAASKQIPTTLLHTMEFIGELALTGALRPVTGLLSAITAAMQTGRALCIPSISLFNSPLPLSAEVRMAPHLLDVCAYLAQKDTLSTLTSQPSTVISTPAIDIADVKGQSHAKRALEIAATGNHHILLVGPPGTGKTLLASCLPNIMPPLTQEEAIEVSLIHSLENINAALSSTRPYRTPHHTASATSLVGGGNTPKPGEISLAHQGVLFLDELAEFKRPALEALREPLECGEITISRAKYSVKYPARFQLIAAMNPCPCGHYGDKQRCQCSTELIKRYQQKISGPVLDRIDLQIRLTAINHLELATQYPTAENSAVIRERVSTARASQYQRQGKTNANLNQRELKIFCTLTTQEQSFLNQAADKLQLSLRGYDRVLKVARTIADLAASPMIHKTHLTEALSYRFITQA